MAFGDSLTEGERTPAFWGTHDPGTPGIALSYPFKLWALLKTIYTSQTIDVYNAGYGGEGVATSQARARFLDMLRTYTPQLVILMHGTNDLNAGTERGVIIGAVEDLIGDAQARGVTLFLSSVPRQLPGVGNPPKGTAALRVPNYNEDLRRMALEEGVTFVDIYPHITDDMISRVDGLHLTQAGNQKLAEVYYEAIKARYHVPAPATTVVR